MTSRRELPLQESDYRIPEGAPERTDATGTAADFVPPQPTLALLRQAAEGCRGCHLWTCGTQTVFGAGPRDARLMLVGEQPGDMEDLEGRPFVGPSGQLLDRALEAAGITREEAYVTNAVKHFKWERGERGGRRIHKKPDSREIQACFPWLRAEIAVVQPEVIVCLGATAAQALLGKDFRVTRSRGKAQRSEWADAVFATVHPSAVLRAPAAQRARAESEFFNDLRVVGRYLTRHERALDREVPLRTAREAGRRAPAARSRREHREHPERAD